MSVIIPDIIRPKILVMPTVDINIAACEVDSDLDTAISGMYVTPTDCTANMKKKELKKLAHLIEVGFGF